MFDIPFIRLQRLDVAGLTVLLALALTLLFNLLIRASEMFPFLPAMTAKAGAVGIAVETPTTFIYTTGIVCLTAMVAHSGDDRIWRKQNQHQSQPQRLQQDDYWCRATIESSFDAIYFLRAVRDESNEIIDFQFIDLNGRGAKLISHCREEVIHQRLCELLPVNRTMGFLDKYKAVVETGIPLEEEFSTELMPGVTAQWLSHQVVPIADGIAITSRDITERKQAEMAIAASEKLYRTLAEAMVHYVMQLDMNGKIQYVNPQWQKDLGVTAEEINERGWSQLLHPDEAEGILVRWQQAFENRESITEEFRYRMADGSYRWFLGQLLTVKDEQGEVMHWIGSAIDIDDRKRFEQELQRREQAFRRLAENSPDVIARVDRELRHLYVNPAVTKATGLAPSAFIGKTNLELGMPLELTRFWQSKLSRVFVTGQADSYEFNFPSPDGTRYYLARVIPEFDADGKVESVLGITSDITDMKLAEQEIRRSEARFRRVVESNMIGMGFWDLEGNMQSANDALLSMLGYTQEEFYRQKVNWRAITPSEYETLDNKALQETAENGFCVPYEKELFRKDGSRVSVLCGGATFEESHDSGVFFLVDLTERKKIESECERLLKLERAARAEAETANRLKDEFLDAISHELRTPLNPILGWTKLLRSRPFSPEQTARALQTIERNARLQAQLVEDLLDISQILRGNIALNYYPVNVVYAVDAAIASVSLSATAKGIQIHPGINRATGQVLGNQQRIQQVIWNLLSNAIKFTPAGGRVEITVEPVRAFAEIRVSDTGQGIEPDFLPYVFDYFRQEDGGRTRSVGGLGLGLAISRHLVELHGGTIEAASPGTGQGATFTVRLPLLQNQPQDHWKENGPTLLLDEALTGVQVLVVDEENDSRELLIVALKQAGAQVTATASVREAMLLLANTQPDVLISDPAMPEEDGYSLMNQIRLLEPDLLGAIPAIALTAITETMNPQRFLTEGFQQQLEKPVEPEALISAVARLVQSPSSVSFME